MWGNLTQVPPSGCHLPLAEEAELNWFRRLRVAWAKGILSDNQLRPVRLW